MALTYSNLCYILNTIFMGLVYAEVELINAADIANAGSNFIDKNNIRKMTVNMLVDSGAYMIAINEIIQQQLRLPIVEKRIFELAGGQSVEYDIVSQEVLRFKNRLYLVDAVLLPEKANHFRVPYRWKT